MAFKQRPPGFALWGAGTLTSYALCPPLLRSGGSTLFQAGRRAVVLPTAHGPPPTPPKGRGAKQSERSWPKVSMVIIPGVWGRSNELNVKCRPLTVLKQRPPGFVFCGADTLYRVPTHGGWVGGESFCTSELMLAAIIFGRQPTHPTTDLCHIPNT
jgi:hypothetical protein